MEVHEPTLQSTQSCAEHDSGADSDSQSEET